MAQVVSLGILFFLIFPLSKSLFSSSQGSHSCPICSNQHGLIQYYSLNMHWQCFCQYAKDIGTK
uniref:Uncharacterized protein n=1 Tax=Marmota marmota marmota TaxID=9994 RepID=A0A8C5Z130_MARMA